MAREHVILSGASERERSRRIPCAANAAMRPQPLWLNCASDDNQAPFWVPPCRQMHSLHRYEGARERYSVCWDDGRPWEQCLRTIFRLLGCRASRTHPSKPNTILRRSARGLAPSQQTEYRSSIGQRVTSCRVNVPEVRKYGHWLWFWASRASHRRVLCLQQLWLRVERAVLAQPRQMTFRRRCPC